MNFFKAIGESLTLFRSTNEADIKSLSDLPMFKDLKTEDLIALQKEGLVYFEP